MATNPSGVGQGHEHIVVDDAARSASVEFSVDGDHRPKEDECLVDQVGAEVVEEAAGLRWVWILAPAALSKLRNPALEAGLIAMNTAEAPLCDEPA
jgi:hypothetical protein